MRAPNLYGARLGGMGAGTMRRDTVRPAAVALVALLALIAAGAVSADQGAEPTYLTILGQPEEFAAEFPPTRADAPRQIGFSILLYTLRTPPEHMARLVEQALDKAEATGYPVLIHCDDWNYPRASADPEVVEWTAFPRRGERHGPLVWRRWINWGSWFTTEAPPNYESSRFRADLKQRLRAIAEPIAHRLHRWRAEGRAYLFAGLVVGWESGYYTAPAFPPDQRPRVGEDELRDSEIVQTGYAALAARGHTAESVRRRARREGKSEPQVLRELMQDVVHDYTAFMAGVCRSTGISRDRIYTHYTGVSALPDAAVPADLRQDGRTMPLWAAVNDDSRPGITATVPWTDVVRAARILGERGRHEWGAVEVEFTDATRSQEAALSYLDALSGSGARVICVYGWWEPPGHTFGVRGSGAVPAMEQWLAGGRK